MQSHKLKHKEILVGCYYYWFVIQLKAGNIANSLAFYFPHNHHPMKWLGLKESNWTKDTQLNFMSKKGLELRVF